MKNPQRRRDESRSTLKMQVIIAICLVLSSLEQGWVLVSSFQMSSIPLSMGRTSWRSPSNQRIKYSCWRNNYGDSRISKKQSFLRLETNWYLNQSPTFTQSQGWTHNRISALSASQQTSDNESDFTGEQAFVSTKAADQSSEVAQITISHSKLETAAQMQNVLSSKVVNAFLLIACFGFVTYTVLNVDHGMTRGWSVTEKAMRIPLDNWSSYESSLNNQPIITKTAINVVIYLLGDWLSQTIFVKKNVLDFDALRTIRNGFIGMCFGPLVHEYYEFSDYILPVEVGINRLYKIFMDQTIYLSVKCSIYIVAVSVLSGESWEDGYNKVKDKIVGIMFTAWRFWPLVHCVTYGVIPARHRILWVNCVDLVWNAILALKTSATKDVDEENAEKTLSLDSGGNIDTDAGNFPTGEIEVVDNAFINTKADSETEYTEINKSDSVVLDFEVSTQRETDVDMDFNSELSVAKCDNGSIDIHKEELASREFSLDLDILSGAQLFDEVQFNETKKSLKGFPNDDNANANIFNDTQTLTETKVRFRR